MSCDSNLSNYSCRTSTFCGGPSNGSPCKSCLELTEGYSCKCNVSLKNCKQCNGTRCGECIDYFLIGGDGKCVNNFCSAFISQCADKKRCLSTTVERTDCIDCVIGQTEQCKCGDKLHCETCDNAGTQCQTCLLGYENKHGNCVLKQNICNEYGQSEFCDNNYYCDSTFGEFCKNCSELKIGQFCKCPEGSKKNCILCGLVGCETCLPLYAVQFGNCKLNTCGQIQNTLNCAFNNFCQSGSAPNQECVPCNGLQECNCGTILGCKTCGTSLNTCGSCFTGFHLENEKCVKTPNTCEENKDSSNCQPGYFCNGVFGEACLSCVDIPLNRSCQCDTIGIQNCTHCTDQFCTQCIPGKYPVNNICVQNTCFGGQSSSFCAINNYCPASPVQVKIVCQLCDNNSPVACNCGTAENCATCDDTSTKCKLCLNGFNKVGETCVRETNICDSNQSSSFCDTNKFCDGLQGDQCVSCENIKISYSCFCDGNLQQNCKECKSSICKTCLDGFLPLQGTCQPNNCDNDLSNEKCQDGYICASKNPGDNCSACVSRQSVECKCGNAKNCTLCGLTPNTCAECILGTKLNAILQCQIINDESNNICDMQGTSLTCDSGAFCASNPGENCIPCNFLTVGKKCNCNQKLQENCQLCQGKECKFCIDGYAPINGVCVSNTCGDDKKGCLNNFYCPPDYKPDTLCRECNFYITDECKCGTAANCQTCSILQNQCQNCLDGYFLVAGLCIPPQICSNGEICPSNQYCQINGTCEVCLDQQIACSCDKAENCQLCGIAGACINCINGWDQDVNGSCSIPVCNIPPAINQYCAGPNQNKECPNNPILIETMIHPCNCGLDIKGCANCLLVGSGCKDCMKDHTMMSGICIFTPPGYTGSCDENNGSSLCIDGMGCKNQGQCVSCAELTVGHECKCANDVIQLNCIECDGEKCKTCSVNSTLINNACSEFCAQSGQCNDFNMCDIDASACISCNGKYPCKCGESENCMKCNEKLQCNGCLKGYILNSNGSCNICDKGFTAIAENPIVCLIQNDNSLALSWLDIAGCCLAIGIIIAAVIFTIVKCVMKQKRLVFQHNMVI